MTYKFSHRRVACYQHQFKDGELVRFTISETLNERPGAPPRYQAVNTSIVRRSLEDCLAALKASCEREDHKTKRELAAEAHADKMAARQYQSQIAYVCGERD